MSLGFDGHPLVYTLKKKSGKGVSMATPGHRGGDQRAPGHRKGGQQTPPSMQSDEN